MFTYKALYSVKNIHTKCIHKNYWLLRLKIELQCTYIIDNTYPISLVSRELIDVRGTSGR